MHNSCLNLYSSSIHCSRLSYTLLLIYSCNGWSKKKKRDKIKRSTKEKEISLLLWTCTELQFVSTQSTFMLTNSKITEMDSYKRISLCCNRNATEFNSFNKISICAYTQKHYIKLATKWNQKRNYIKRSFNTHYCDLMEEFLPLRQLLSKKMYIYQNSRDHHLRPDLLSCITLYTLLSAAFFPMSTPSAAPNLLYKMLRMLWLQLRIPDYKPIYPNSTCWRQQLKAEIPNSNFTAHCIHERENYEVHW